MNKKNIQDVYRLTSLQQGMLFHALSAPGSGVYVEQFACPTAGLIDRTLWQQAWNLVLAGYPVLRSAIAWEGLEHPLQVVMHEAHLEVAEIDAGADDDTAFAARLEALRRADAARGFDLRSAPLVRQTLLHRRDASVVFWTYHHILLDGWSAFILLEALLSAYTALVDGKTWQPRTAPPYRNYLSWLKQRDLGAAESYWRQRLSGFHAPTSLGLVERDIVAPDASSATIAAQLGATLALQLRNGARTLRVTAGTLLQAAWAYTLSIYCGDNDIVFGATVAGRPPELDGADGMVGLFINTVPVRVHINPVEPVRAFAARLQTELLAQRAHEHAALTDIAGWSNVPRGRPLFDSMLAIESFPYTDGVSLADVTVWQQTNFPLALVIEPVGDMRVKALFDASRHPPDTITRLLDHYRRVLEQLVTQLDTPLGTIGLCPPSDTAIQAAWNNRPAVGEAGIDLGELFTRQVAAAPGATAVVAGDVQVSYAQLDAATSNLATRLQAAGVAAGDTVAFAFEPGADMIAALIAITRLGCAYAPLDARLPPARLAEMVSDLKIRHIVAENAYAGLFDLPGVTVLLPGGSVKASDLIGTVSTPWPRAQAGRLLYVIHTSGSTGKPKAAGVFHASFVRFIQWWNSEYALGADDRCLLINKITFDLAQKCVWGALTTGGTLHLAPTRHFDPLLARELVASQAITWINCTPSMAYAMVECDSAIGALASMRMLFVGGEPVDKRRLAPWLLAAGCRTDLINTYGPTECTDLCTTHRFTRAEFEQLSQPVTVGRVLPGLAVHVLDRFGNCLPLGVTGEVAIAGGSVGVGYLNNARMSGEKFLPDAGADAPGERLYLTGDLGYFRPDGTLIVRGRTDFQVKLRGYRIELDAIGHELCSHAQVRDAVAVVAPDGQQLVAYVVPKEGVPWSDALRSACQAHLGARLPEYMVPAHFVALERLPLNANGKLDRAALPAPDMSAMMHEHIAPRDEIETRLAEIWSGVLGRSDFGVSDNFFELGGHSLSITQCYARLPKAFGVKIALSVLFEQPTIAEQAAALRAAGAGANSVQHAVPTIDTGVRPERIPLSFSQSRLWFLHQYDPTSIAYHVPNALRLPGIVDRAALAQTLDWLHARHETLRTRFPEADGTPWQDVQAAAPVPFLFDDLRDCDDAAERLGIMATEEAGAPFDLQHGPVARYRLVQTDDGAVLLATLHHIATDGWSMDVMMREIATAYRVFGAGEVVALAPLPIQYADYALWQRADLTGEKLQRQLDYWRTALAGSDAQITLPYDMPRPVAHSVAGRLHVSRIPAGVCAGMRQVAEAGGATGFMAWLATYELLLYRWSGQKDFNIGSPIANRHHEETEGLIGFFVNTLVLRANVDRGQRFSELLQLVRQTSQQAFEHSELPFELLVDRLNPPRNAAYLPFFQIGFALQRAYEDTSLIDTTEWVARFDLQLVLYEEADGGLRAHWEYARDLFKPETIERLAESFTLLAQQIALEPDRLVQQYELMEAAQRRTILETWNDTERPLPQPCCVHQLFELQVRLAPAAIALICDTTAVRYDELNQRANRLARYLRERGVGQGSLVGICLARSPDLIVALLAILKTGGAYLPLDPLYPQERLAYMLDNSGARLVLTVAALAVNLPECAAALLIDSDAIAAFEDSNLDLPSAPDNLAYVMYTSGSTGRPKGVMIEHRAIIRLVKNTHYADLSAQQVFLQFAPIAFDASTLEVWGSLLNGAQLVQAPEGAAGLEQLATLMEGRRISTMFLTTALFNQLVDEQPQALRGIRQLMTGGDAISVSHAGRALQAMENGRLVHVYGPTEATTFSTFHLISAADIASGVVPIGRPIANTQVYVLDAALEPSPVGVAGELFIGGPGLARGYVSDPELSAEKFLANPFGPSGTRLYRSGDRVRWNAEGNIEFLGRIDNQVKIRGYRIEPGEIEVQLRTHPSVQEALVVVLTDPHGDGADKRLVAYVIGAQADPAALREYLAQRLPAFMVPSAYVVLERWPVNANGKVDRQALPLPGADAQGAGEYVEPATNMERTVAGIWGELLGLERVGVTSDFFVIGGNSLTATQLLARVRTHLGSTITLPAFFAEPTVRAMAYRLDNEAQAMADDDNEAPLDGAVESMLALPDRLPPLASGMEQVLLTGATGFIGAYLVAEILQRWSRVVLHCHVRARNQASGMQRLRDNLVSYGLWRDEYATRIRILIADLAVPGLGLPAEPYAALARDIDLVIHNASHLNHVLPYRALRQDNVEPTRNLLQLALTSKLKGFMYVSTAGVVHGDRKGRTVDETLAIELEQQTRREGYNASKWVSELMVRRVAAAGAPAQVVRLGRVVIDSRSGAGRLEDFVALFISTCLRIGAYPDFPLVEQVVPVDHVARAITALAGDYSSTGVYHLIGDDKRNWSKLLPDFVDCADAGLKCMPMMEWIDTIKSRSATESLPFAPYLFWWDTDAGAPEEKRLKIRQLHTARQLNGMGVHEPRVEDAAWQRYLGEIFAAEGRVMKPRKRSLF
jgi:amino acid adenylation domain-containing protein/thioester reductase-like protein